MTLFRGDRIIQRTVKEVLHRMTHNLLRAKFWRVRKEGQNVSSTPQISVF